jgi:catechol 2,3-dioxygenase-like lactoylglutathione lyase family enzyme
MIVSMNHISFTVSELNVSVAFYRDILGLKVKDISNRDQSFAEQVTGIKGSQIMIAYLEAHNCSVELIQYINPVGKKIDTSTNNIGSAHVCFVIDEYDEHLKLLRDNNVQIVSKGNCIIPAGPNRGKSVMYFHDPDCNTIEFISK